MHAALARGRNCLVLTGWTARLDALARLRPQPGGCLREDLGQAVPAADTPLDEVPHPLLAKASDRFADDGTPQERIASIETRSCSK